MTLLDNIGFDYKITAGFGAAALILSMLVGLVSGVGFGTVFIRSLLFTVVFAALGYGIVYVVKRFVPELFEAVKPADKTNQSDNPSVQQDNDSSSGIGSVSDDNSGRQGGSAEPGGFKEFSDDDYVSYQTSSTKDMDSAIDGAKSSTLGKHIVINEKIAKYEPKIMAQAVRTMMNKEE